MYSKKSKNEILKLLNRTTVTPEMLSNFQYGQTNNMDSLIPLCNFMKHHVPESLYRIRRPTERNLLSLENDEIYAVNATKFNDPYDCLLYFNEKKLCDDIINDINMGAYNEYLNNRIMEYNKSGNKVDVERVKEVIEEYRPKFIQQIKDNFPKVTESLQVGTYISCFTECIDSPIMWSHYGAEHKGFAIEYGFPGEFCSPHYFQVIDVDYPWYGWRSILPVIYSDVRFDGTELATWLSYCDIEEIVKNYDIKYDDLNTYQSDMLLKTKMCLYKAKEWAYENEWRLIFTHEWPNDPGNYRIHINYPPKAIYLGARIEEGYKEKLIGIAHNKNIPVYRMFVDCKTQAYTISMKEYSKLD